MEKDEPRREGRRMEKVTLRKVSYENVWRLTELKVSEAQMNFVATNAESLIEAYLAISAGGVAMPFGIYAGDRPVGFLMIGYDCTDWEDAPLIAHGNYCIWRLMIDSDEQGKGYGRAALEEVLGFIKTFPCGNAEYCFLSYEPENTVAKSLYESFGFVENGEFDGDEAIAVLHL